MSASSDAVLVTGAAGFAGSHLVELLTGRCDLAGWTRSEPPAALARLARWTRINLLDRDAVRRAIRDLRPGRIYHLAGAPSVAGSWEQTTGTLTSNVLASHYLLDAVRRAGCGSRVLVAGSSQIYAGSSSPLDEQSAIAVTSPYGLSKIAQEEIGRRVLAEDGIDTILVRPFNHTGPRQKALFAAPSMARQIAVGEIAGSPLVIRVGNLEAKRDISDVRDVVRAYVLLMERGRPGIPYNVASGVARPIRSVLDALIAQSKVPVTVELDPERLRPNDTPILVGDAGRLRAATGWTPEIGFDRMLTDLLEYWRAEVRN